MKLVAIALALAACLPQQAATEVVITVDTPFGVPCTIDALHFVVTDDAGTVEEDVPLEAGDLPGSITLVRHGSENTATVEVWGMRAGDKFATAMDEVEFAEHDSRELRVVLDRSCVPGPCKALGLGEWSQLPAPQPKRGCGATAYSWRASLFELRDACDMAPLDAQTTILKGAVGAGLDEAEAPAPFMPLPFPFRFYNQPVSTIWVGINGYLAFTDTTPNALKGSINAARPLDAPDGFPVPGAMPFWDDLMTSTYGICFATTGEAPDRFVWITWKKACFWSSTTAACGAQADGVLTFSAAIEETSDRIYFGYEGMTGVSSTLDRAQGQAATVGVKSAAAVGCPAAQCATNGMCSDGTTACGYTQISSLTKFDEAITYELDPGP